MVLGPHTITITLTTMAKKTFVSDKMKLVLVLLVLQLCFAGFHIVSRLALNMGISKVVYPVYRNIIALLLITPFAYFLEKKERPALTISLLAQFFFLALIGITANQGFYLLGLYYTSPTFSSAMQNSVPAITFLMASSLGLEKVNFWRRDGVAKVLGTIASVGGASVITLYKGPPLLHHNLMPLNLSADRAWNWTWGCMYLIGHCFSWAGWMVFQAPVLRKYPAKLTLTSFTLFFGLIQFLVIAAFLEPEVDRWKISSMEELCTILYAGIVASGMVLFLQTWCIHKGGPVFVAVFQPVQTLLVVIMAALTLGDQLFLGGIIGAMLIMIGLYSVLWGKSEESKIAIHEKEDMLDKHLLENGHSKQNGNNIDAEIP